MHKMADVQLCNQITEGLAMQKETAGFSLHGREGRESRSQIQLDLAI
jgi:hypothetical protein